ncbi:protein FAM114A2 [Hyalella azteca]|uniref:Protein FAM114A2 n=1 Tax=Hyalella azteca TaxID=294128 RepID=A0A8B7NVI7_HYAAZ|nr:protein FAM114A2 [Hyalella azteca]XP_047736592.1 protein FAM114A2 [Hyalella azteca]
MASDSEEDFQSADEGSDSDGYSEKVQTCDKGLPLPISSCKTSTTLPRETSPNQSSSTRKQSAVTTKDINSLLEIDVNVSNVAPNSQVGPEKCPDSQDKSDKFIESLENLSVRGSILDEYNSLTTNNRLAIKKESTNETIDDKNSELIESVSEIESNVLSDFDLANESTEIEQGKIDDYSSVTNIRCKEMSETSELLQSIDICKKKEIQSKKLTENSIYFVADNNTLENLEAHKTETDHNSVYSEIDLSKAKKTSKIGLKKPREKLGEKLGAKKLAQRLNKPLEGISCDALVDSGNSEQASGSPIDQKSEPPKESTSGEASAGWGGGWGSWGSTLLSAATTLTQEVGRGVGSVVELVEEGMGVPSPEELAREQLEREKMLQLWDDWGDQPPQGVEFNKEMDPSKMTQDNDPSANSEDVAIKDITSNSRSSLGGLGFGGLSSLVSGVSGALESAGSKVVYGGLDTLELIGRRTMDVLQETDPGLRAKKDRILQRVKKPNLSAVLKEAREQAVANPPPGLDSPTSPGLGSSTRVSFSCLWSNCTGPAHLEALALIARQCTATAKEVMASLPALARDEVHQTNSQIMALSEIEEENLTGSSIIFAERVETTIRDLQLPLNADNIAQCWSDLSAMSAQYSEGSVSLLEAVASVEAGGSTIETNLIGGCVALVERLVAIAHKAAELSLISGEQQQDPLKLAANFRELVVLGGSQLESCADAVCAGLSSTPQQEHLTPVITNIYMQVCEGNSCLQQSLVHLCTTLQLVVTQRAAALL